MTKIKQELRTSGTGNNFAFEEIEINPFAKALMDFELENPITKLKTGTEMSGIVSLKNEKYTLLNINNKSDVVIDNNNFERIHLDNLNLGDNVDFLIIDLEDKKEFIINGSIHALKMQEVQGFLSIACTEKTILTGIPRVLNHAGYTIEVIINDISVSLFMPHLLTDVNKLPNPESIIDTEIDFILIPSNKEGKKSFIASRKAHLINMAKSEIYNIITGDVYSGCITGTTDFGVFVQFNECLTGMIHKSNLTDQAKEMLKNNEIYAGTSIEFYVKDILETKRGTKLYLTQIMRESLWDSIEVNDELIGKVSSIKDFGILVQLDYETKGLLHKSVLSDHLTTYKKGEDVSVIVTNVNKNNRQIALALK